MNDICMNLKTLRNKRRYSQGFVADHLGINRATYTQMENGNRKITVEDIVRLCELYGVSMDDLINGRVGKESMAMSRWKENGKIRLMIIVGTRPEIIRLSEVIKKCRKTLE